ncbi:uncharacterized protein LOC110857532 [Folsomia candida]|uniref:uncharacterized protein LOC110857532 n=1 Tax=Folsomia candida TaxID=158441 RepID=UPI000B8FEE28|nr:uncharacterized protein LOC110857532 [Folsomia candida]XP_035713996.1 uncharacterized protein LOC110857532 [Folsomia candida]
MKTLIIRPLLESDYGQVFQLIKELSTSPGEQNIVKFNEKDFLFANPKKNSSSYFSGIVAIDKIDKIVGVLLYHTKYSTWEGEGPGIQINTFFVTECYRRRGVGYLLLQNICMSAEEKGQQISIPIRKHDVAGMEFFMKHHATNLTSTEGWLNYHLNKTAVENLLNFNDKKGKNVILRPAEAKDCNHIEKMIQDLNEFENIGDQDNKLDAKTLQRDGFQKTSPDFYSFVAELNDGENGLVKIVGYNLMFFEFNPIHGKLVHLEDIYVKEEHRGEGIGVKLFKQVARFALDNGCQGFTLEVLDSNTKAIKFYEAFGGVNLSIGENGVQSVKLKKAAIHRIFNTDKISNSNK